MKLNSICGFAMIGMGSGEVGERMTELTDVVIESRPAAGVALLEINRPEALNALNMDIRQSLRAKVEISPLVQMLKCLHRLAREKFSPSGFIVTGRASLVAPSL
jgi:hypothetical protein